MAEVKMEPQTPIAANPEQPKLEPRFKWQDALGILGAFLAVGGMSDMPLWFRLSCFFICAVTAPLSFSSHKSWPLSFRWIASALVVLVLGAVSWFAVHHPEQKVPTSAEIANDVANLLPKQPGTASQVPLPQSQGSKAIPPAHEKPKAPKSGLDHGPISLSPTQLPVPSSQPAQYPPTSPVSSSPLVQAVPIPMSAYAELGGVLKQVNDISARWRKEAGQISSNYDSRISFIGTEYAPRDAPTFEVLQANQKKDRDDALADFRVAMEILDRQNSEEWKSALAKVDAAVERAIKYMGSKGLSPNEQTLELNNYYQYRQTSGGDYKKGQVNLDRYKQIITYLDALHSKLGNYSEDTTPQ